MSDEKIRASLDAARDPAQPVLPTVNPAMQKRSEPDSASFHPAVYISTWIALSSSVIIFNKYILDTANFRTSHLLLTTAQLLIVRQTSVRSATCPSTLAFATNSRSYLPDDMASRLRYHHDPAPCAFHLHTRLAEEGAHDGPRIPPRDCPDRHLLQFELDLWKQSILVPECCFYPDAQGM